MHTSFSIHTVFLYRFINYELIHLLNSCIYSCMVEAQLGVCDVEMEAIE